MSSHDSPPAAACLCRCPVMVLVALMCAGCSEEPAETFERGWQAFREGDTAELRDCIQRLEADDPTSDYALFLGALISERGKDFYTALKLMAQVDPHGPLRRRLLLHSGICYHQSGLLPQAVHMLQVLTEEFPDDVDGRRWAGIVFYDLGAYDYSIAQLRRAAELDPDDYGALRLLGVMYCDFERNAEAIDVLTQALQRDPPREVRREMTELLGQALMAERRYAEALDVLRQGPPSPAIYAYQAECLVNLGDVDQAHNAIDQGLKMDDRHRDVLFRQASMLSVAGDRQQAADILSELVQKDPYDAEARYQLALMLRATGDTVQADEQMREWERQKKLADELTERNVEALSRPFDAELRLRIAELCDQLGKKELAAMWRRVADGVTAPPRAETSRPGGELPSDGNGNSAVTGPARLRVPSDGGSRIHQSMTAPARAESRTVP